MTRPILTLCMFLLIAIGAAAIHHASGEHAMLCKPITRATQ